MKLLEEYITKTGKQPADWTLQDIQKYLDHVQAQIAKAAPSKGYDNWSSEGGIG
jgi:hypothetical protein